MASGGMQGLPAEASVRVPRQERGLPPGAAFPGPQCVMHRRLVCYGTGLDQAQRLARTGLLVSAALAAAGAATEFSLLLVKPRWAASERCSVPEAARQSVFRGATDWSYEIRLIASLIWWIPVRDGCD